MLDQARLKALTWSMKILHPDPWTIKQDGTVTTADGKMLGNGEEESWLTLLVLYFEAAGGTIVDLRKTAETTKKNETNNPSLHNAVK